MSKHVTIVGGGIIGLFAAHYCLRDGHRVTVVERGSQRRDGCSFGNAGMIVPSHFVPLAAPGMIRLGLKLMWNPQSPFFIRPRLSGELLSWLWKFSRACSSRRVEAAAPLLRDLHLRSREDYAKLQSELNADFGLQRQGLLMLCASRHGLEEETRVARMAEQLRVPVRVLDARETSQMDPSVTMDVQGAVYYPLDCHLAPERLMAALQSRLAEDGCEFTWDTEVTDFATKDDQVTNAITNHGEIAADVFVIAGGSWSTSLARRLGIRIPMQSGKGYSLTIPNPPETPSICSILTEARVAVTPMGSSLRFGGTLEIGTRNGKVNPARVRGIVRSIPRYFPEFATTDFDGIQAWSGLRPCSPDGLPYLGSTKRWDNVVISTGHSMMGISLAPISGRIVAECVAGRSHDGLDPRQLSPDRY